MAWNTRWKLNYFLLSIQNESFKNQQQTVGKNLHERIENRIEILAESVNHLESNVAYMNTTACPYSCTMNEVVVKKSKYKCNYVHVHISREHQCRSAVIRCHLHSEEI